MSDQYLLKTLANAIEVLSLFEEEVSLAPKEIAERIDMNRTNLFRILYTLRHGGLLELDPKTGKYQIGMKTIHLASLSLQRLDIKHICHPYLVSLRDLVEETVHLVVINNNLATFIDKIGANEDVHMGSYVGWTAPLYCTASGKLLLSFEPDKVIKEYFETVKLKRYTDNTIYNFNTFLKNIREIREVGYSIDKEEMVEGLTCFAIPIKEHKGHAIASISVSGPTTRMNKKRETIIEQLQQTSQEISSMITKIPENSI